ncbi:deiodinase-like protein [Cognatiyoonia sp. IB215182]|uniref:deiodinase-like protein n=1 Tax=Cognatiyoonia sp. IB215182 TaxID=3097353 RepID=UPI002A0C95A3|nr:deiodinase-like protein [Cognatiyoonia sp. IB215182]MDX8354109.1 deiodinase-like protein [Cognatiyoonia sp. IB215182]
MTTKTYGYRRFTPEEYDFTVDEGLKAGDIYKDATLQTLDGATVQLSDYLRDKPLVLETGSMTCPMYAQSVPPMMQPIEKYPGLDHVLLYVREAHPGELQPQHRTEADKITAAQKTKRRYRDGRTILVDDVNGSAHRFYGTMPNSIFVIAPDGKILFRSIWNNANEMDAILGAIARGEPVQSRELKAVPPFSFRAVLTLLMGGIVAVWDFVRGLHQLVANHKKVGNM